MSQGIEPPFDSCSVCGDPVDPAAPLIVEDLCATHAADYWAEMADDAIEPPSDSYVEIGGQRMAEAQFHAARFPLLHPDPGLVMRPDDEEWPIDDDE